jgi:hypothetical protein
MLSSLPARTFRGNIRRDYRSPARPDRYRPLLYLLNILYLLYFLRFARFAAPRNRRKETSNIFFIHIAAEPFSAQHFVEFGQRCKGQQDFSFLERQVNRFAWF